MTLKPSFGIRDFIARLRNAGDLLSIRTPLDPKYEISTILSELGKKEGPAILIENVKGYQFPVVGNLLGTKKRLSMALGVDPEDLVEASIPKLEKRLPPVLVSDSFQKAAPYINIVYTLMGSILMFGLLGWWLDKKFSMKPWLLLSGLFLGLVVGFYHLFKIVKKLEKNGN